MENIFISINKIVLQVFPIYVFLLLERISRKSTIVYIALLKCL